MKLYVPLAAILCCILVSCHDTFGNLHQHATLDINERATGDITHYAVHHTNKQSRRNDLRKRGAGQILSAIFGIGSKIAKVVPKVATTIIKVSSHGLTYVSLALTFANALTGGCATHPKICSLKKDIESYEKKARDASAYLESHYDKMRADAKKVREIVTNNVYFEKYTEGVLDKLKDCSTLAESIDDILAKSFERHGVNITSEADLKKKIAVQQEFLIQNVQKYFEKTKKSALKEFGKNLGIQLGIQLVSVGIEAGITKGIKMYRKLGSPTMIKSKFKVFGQRLKFAFKTRKLNLKFSPKNFAKKIKAKIGSKMKGLVKKLKNPKGLVKNFFSGTSKVAAMANGVSMAMTALSLYLENKKWAQVEQELEKTLQNYKKYEKDLNAEQANLNATDKNMTRVLDEVVDNFRKMLSSFDGGFKDTMKGTGIIEAFGRSKDIPKEAVELLSVGEINNDNILQKQTQVMDTVQNSAFSLNIFNGFLEGLKVTLEIINNGIKKDQELSQMFNILKISFTTNKDLKNLTSTFVDISKVMCALANILPDKTQFGSVPLESIRKPCLVPDTNILTPEYKKERTDFGIKFTIKAFINDAKARGKPDDISALISSVSKFLENDPLVTKDIKISNSSKELWCMIADVMPNLSEYDHFDLSKVRGSACSKISKKEFQNIISKVTDTKNLWKQIEILRQFNNDPCILSQVRKSGLIKC